MGEQKKKATTKKEMKLLNMAEQEAGVNAMEKKVVQQRKTRLGGGGDLRIRG